MSRWSDSAWEAARPVYEKILEHPFVRALADGTLSAERFRFYLRQDALYLVGLDARAAARVAAGDGQGAFVGSLRVAHIFHVSSCHALSQKSHSMRVQRTKMSVMRRRVPSPAASASASQMAVASAVEAAKAGSA